MLARKSVKGVHMRFETSDEVCRVRYSEHSTSDPHSKVSKKSTIKLCQLDSALRHLVITETVCIEGGLVGHLTRNTLQRSLKRHINSLDLINCTISLGFEEFANFLRRLRVRNVTLIDCTIEDVQLIGDPLFEINKQIAFVDVQFPHLQHCPLLTDRTLKEWADSLSWPQTILLRTLHSNITRQGVATMIESYIRWCKKQRAQPIPRLRSSQSLLWNFGTIDGDVKQLENAIGKLKKCMKITVIEASEEQFAAIIRFDRSSPVLHLRTSFASRKRK
ncbi:unnamed protein product [Anisakis simplex]|uniref:F-box domain-containing protein n=1 Tax=Anisakis simplex TaxID=6269 RepID=A0A0M3J0S4_ANISI|nr:unnamed protein product [Anisakis simplex]